ncbi:MAG: DUF4854 domain-containing protein [Treponemataceae bacterium]|nr:DUF4854 domain-containing protein [Treponemataceae bacterium]MDE6719645.1 DUF4854 domain-containing protein [Treponemataceae bacterium]
MKKVFFFAMFVLSFNFLVFSDDFNLEKFYSQPAMKKQMNESFKQFNALDKTMEYSYKVKNNTMVYIYKFTEQQKDIEACRETIILRLRNSVIDFVITNIENESGVKDVRVQYIYYNKDGTEIYNQIWMK